MEFEDKKILKEMLELVEANNKILRKLLRAQRMGIFITVLKWLIITGAAVSLFYLLQPIFDQFKEIYSGLGNIYESAGSIFKRQ